MAVFKMNIPAEHVTIAVEAISHWLGTEETATAARDGLAAFVESKVRQYRREKALRTTETDFDSTDTGTGIVGED